MSEVRFSISELRYLKEIFELVLEELEGVEEATDYVLTTGGKEEALDCVRMLELKEKFLEPDSYEPLDFDSEDSPPWHVQVPEDA